MMAACLLLAMQMHPHWRQRIEEEFAPLSEAEIHALPMARIPCTMRFLKEVMRLYSTPFNNRRVAACDLQVEGQQPSESVFELSSFIQHRSAKYWDDPLQFDPDRWLPERRKRTAGIYVPYGFPTRSCVGSAVGNAQLVLLCALLAREFRFTPAPTIGPRCAWRALRFRRRCMARSRGVPVPDLSGRRLTFPFARVPACPHAGSAAARRWPA